MYVVDVNDREEWCTERKSRIDIIYLLHYWSPWLNSSYHRKQGRKGGVSALEGELKDVIFV